METADVYPYGLRTRGSWVQILPGAPEFKHLDLQNQVLVPPARPLRDQLFTGAQDSRGNSSAIRDAQDRSGPHAIEHSVGKRHETPHIGARVELGHRPYGMAEQGTAILLGDPRGP